jgi:hypothetical protein
MKRFDKIKYVLKLTHILAKEHLNFPLEISCPHKNSPENRKSLLLSTSVEIILYLSSRRDQDVIPFLSSLVLSISILQSIYTTTQIFIEFRFIKA